MRKDFVVYAVLLFSFGFSDKITILKPGEVANTIPVVATVAMTVLSPTKSVSAFPIKNEKKEKNKAKSKFIIKPFWQFSLIKQPTSNLSSTNNIQVVKNDKKNDNKSIPISVKPIAIVVKQLVGEEKQQPANISSEPSVIRPKYIRPYKASREKEIKVEQVPVTKVNEVSNDSIPIQALDCHRKMKLEFSAGLSAPSLTQINNTYSSALGAMSYMPSSRVTIFYPLFDIFYLGLETQFGSAQVAKKTGTQIYESLNVNFNTYGAVFYSPCVEVDSFLIGMSVAGGLGYASYDDNYTDESGATASFEKFREGWAPYARVASELRFRLFPNIYGYIEGSYTHFTVTRLLRDGTVDSNAPAIELSGLQLQLGATIGF